jgi:hypothetical protein
MSLSKSIMPSKSRQDKDTRSRIHERTSRSLKFLGIILSVLGLEVSVYKVYNYKPEAEFTNIQFR